ncbi:NAD(P)H-binding protein [Streptomyces sp. NBC_00243]|uniref:NAD(P)H-binding protein n=1 Tax=Streptomyces sp. NBC_00243 TaxID=2975688 RepID=UPI002DDB1C30|nr:NAD(P)H-binding protein [Streptomyces sp. NBC_00243]WRZ25028.1 NAD(P)H-binding protein [Streptomyces sp. NBC_00243]
MKVVLFGASGMIGYGVLRACLDDDTVKSVTAVVRRPLGLHHPKLHEVVHADFTDLTAVAASLAGVDACYFCLGTPSAGLTEAEYTRVTHDYALAAAHALLPLNDELTFVYVSGNSADSASGTMWARVKGRTEDDLLALPFHAYVFRPTYIRPRQGARPGTRSYRLMYAATSWLYPVLRRLFPQHLTTTDTLGRAMLGVTRLRGSGPRVLTSTEINDLGARPLPEATS